MRLSLESKIFSLLSGLLILWTPGLGVDAWADTGAAHKAAQTLPISLGATGGSLFDRSTLYCCGGTLGGLVTDGVSQYVLSNNHVLAKSNLGTLGDDVIHPGLIDQVPVCTQDANDAVANLTNFVAIQFKKGKTIPLNEVDAAIAEVIPGSVRSDGYILDIGPLSPSTISAFVGQPVQKSGRTTGKTVGSVAAVAVTVDVGYSKECGGAANQVARYINQIRITPGSFSAGGDSGSIIVEGGGVTDPVTHLPRAVGLLFAGSSTSTIANPIGKVLTKLGVTVVNGTSTSTSTQQITTSGASTSPSSHGNPPGLSHAVDVKSRHESEIHGIDGVVGSGVGVSETGTPVVEVYVKENRSRTLNRIPDAIEDVPVRVLVTGEFEAF
jgi:hypothetical protein